MAQYISKSALIAELKKRIKVSQDYAKCNLTEKTRIGNHAQQLELNDILAFLDTLEVKEVDLEKHLKEDIEDVYFDLNGVAVKGATYYLTVEDIKEIAKHFFELGLKAQKL